MRTGVRTIGIPELRRDRPAVGGRRWIDGRPAYLAVTAGLTAAAVGLAACFGVVGLDAVAAGASLAWAIQAGAVWLLMGELDAGRAVLRIWAAGIAARVAGLGLAAGLGAVTAMSSRTLAAAYGVAILGLLLGEAAWLAFRRPPDGGRR